MPAYTNVVFDVADPPDGQAANTAAAEMRQIKSDIKERLETIVEDIDDNPLVLSQSSLPSTPGLGVWMHWSAGHVGDKDDDYFTTNRVYVSPDGLVTVNWFMPCLAPVGITIDQLDLTVYRTAGAGISIAAFSADLATGAETTLGSVVSASTGYHTLTIGSLATVIAANTSIYTWISLQQPAGDCRFLAAKWS